MPHAWISNGDACLLGLERMHCDEFEHKQADISTRAFRTLWNAGRGQDGEGAPLLALDGRFCFFDLSLLMSLVSAVPKLSLLPVNILTTLLGGIITNSNISYTPSPSKEPLVYARHLQGIERQLAILLETDFPFGEDEALRAFAKKYLKEVEAIVRRKQGQPISSVADSVETLALTLESHAELAHSWKEFSPAQKLRLQRFQRDTHSTVLNMLREISNEDSMTRIAFTLGIGAASALILWWYNDRQRFEGIWSWALGKLPLPSFVPNAPISADFQRQLETNVGSALAVSRPESQETVGTQHETHPQRDDNAKPSISNHTKHAISNETISQWWSFYNSWALESIRSHAMSLATPWLIPLPVLAIFALVLCRTRCQFIIKMGIKFARSMWKLLEYMGDLMADELKPFTTTAVGTVQGWSPNDPDQKSAVNRVQAQGEQLANDYNAWIQAHADG